MYLREKISLYEYQSRWPSSKSTRQSTSEAEALGRILIDIKARVTRAVKTGKHTCCSMTAISPLLQ